MDAARWERLEAKRAQQAYFRGLEESAAKAAHRKPAPVPRKRKSPKAKVGRYGPAPLHDGSTSCADCEITLRSKSQRKIEGTRPVAARTQDGEGYLCTTCYSKQQRQPQED